MNRGNELSTLFQLQNCKSRRLSSHDKTGGNHDWWDFEPGETRTISDIAGCGIIRHIWCTHYAKDDEKEEEEFSLSKVVIRAYWDDETEPSILAPLGDFFGLGFGLRKNFSSAAFSFSPQDGRGMSCYWPMPFCKNAKFTIENGCDSHVNFYFYIDYEEYPTDNLGADIGYFHAQWNRERRTEPTAPVQPGVLEKEKAGVSDQPPWYPKAWLATNLDGKKNYVLLKAQGRGKYVGCNLNIDVFEQQSNDWYGEGDDMIFLDGEELPSIKGTGTEDYFNTAFGPSQEFFTPYHGITQYSGAQYLYPFGGKNSMYRLHIADPIHFEESIVVTIEHGHNNKLANDYSSTAYWYQTEPHLPFSTIPPVQDRIPRPNPTVKSE